MNVDSDGQFMWVAAIVGVAIAVVIVRNEKHRLDTPGRNEAFAVTVAHRWTFTGKNYEGLGALGKSLTDDHEALHRQGRDVEAPKNTIERCEEILNYSDQERKKNNISDKDVQDVKRLMICGEDELDDLIGEDESAKYYTERENKYSKKKSKEGLQTQ